MLRTIRHHARFMAALSVAIASGVGLAVAVEGPLANLGLVDQFARSADLAALDTQLGIATPQSRPFHVQSFDHSKVVLPLLVNDLAAAGSSAPRSLAYRSARVRPPILTVPFASK